MAKLHDHRAPVKRPRTSSYPHGIPVPTRGDLVELLAAMLQAWDQADNPAEFMRAVTPHIKQARAFVDAADEQRLHGSDPLTDWTE